MIHVLQQMVTRGFFCIGTHATFEVQLHHVKPFAVVVLEFGSIQIVAFPQNVAHFIQDSSLFKLAQHVFVANLIDVARVELAAG